MGFDLDFSYFGMGVAPEWVERSKLDFSDGLGQVLTIQTPKPVPNTLEHKSPTGVKIFNLDLTWISAILGWAWPLGVA